MSYRNLAIVLLATAFASNTQAQVEQSAHSVEKVFQRVDDDGRTKAETDGALIIGSYALAPIATNKLLKVDALKKAIFDIRHTDWKRDVWTKHNAELTIRQRMDDYLETAREFYSGNGERSQNAIQKIRSAKYTDTELGDRQLSNALKTVRMATAWDVPLQTGQADRLDSVIRLRLTMIDDVTKR